MDDRVREALTVVGFVALLLVWLRAAAVLTVPLLDILPDPVVALVVPAWLLLPFLLLGWHYRHRSDTDGSAGAGTL